MQLKLVLFAIALFGLGVILVIGSNFMVFTLIDEINSRVSADEQLGLIFVRMERVLRRHRALFPDSPKRREMYVVAITGTALWLLAVLLLIFANTK